nr:glycosyltransferase N-terminal domain-containing protein [Cognatishimia sp. F0-27]
MISLFALVAAPGALRDGKLRARLGLGPAVRGRHVWLHGASNGELTAFKPVLLALHAARPDLHWLITSNSRTATALVESWGLERVTARPAPFDLGWATRRIMRSWSVTALMSLESEIWPHRVLHCPGPVLQIAARMKPGTARAWRRLPRLAKAVLRRVDWASAQDTASRDALLALGLRPESAGPVIDLKAFYDPPDTTPDPVLRAAFPREDTWLAASTHEGDEAFVLDAHSALRQRAPGQKLVLAPRHPTRGAEIRAMIEARGLTVAQRSRDEPPEDCDVYLADTMGEMALWYQLCGRVFIAGTLSDRGGHTPYEPAAFGCALLHGPDDANFQPAFARLRDAAASVEVHTPEALCDALHALGDADAQTAGGNAAKTALAQDSDLNGLIEAIAQRLPDPDA